MATGPASEGQAPIEPSSAGGGSDPLTSAARAAGDVANLGVKAAARVAGAALRRLPRP